MCYVAQLIPLSDALFLVRKSSSLTSLSFAATLAGGTAGGRTAVQEDVAVECWDPGALMDDDPELVDYAEKSGVS